MNRKSFANTVIGFFIVISIAKLILNMKMGQPTGIGSALYLYAVPVLVGGMLLFLFLLEMRLRCRAAFLLVSLCASLYLVEVIAHFWFPYYFSFRKGVIYDGRMRNDVVAQMKADGIDCYSNISPQDFLTEKKMHSGKSAIPLLHLGFISNAVTVLCNEGGEFIIFRTDEHGFNNPPGMWSREIDFALVGDSFTHGRCVPPEKNVAGVLRRRYPETLNIGMSGNGPLFVLACIREYLTTLRPEVVIWMYFEGNDLSDLHKEKKDDILPKYLKNDFHQGVIEKQAEIDEFLRNYGDSHVKLQKKIDYRKASPLISILRLTNWRKRIKSTIERPPRTERPLAQWPKNPYDASDLKLFRTVLERARDETRRWNGQLLIVYLPDWERFFQPLQTNNYRREVLQIFEDLKLPFIDIYEVFKLHGEPQSLFPFGEPGHYSEEGYALVAESVLQRISAKPDPPPSGD